LGGSQSAELPDRLELGPFTFIADEASHSTLIEIASSDGQSALLEAVGRIRDVLIALAARGDAYAIDIDPPPKVETLAEPARVTATKSGASVSLDAMASFTGHLGVVVRRGDYSVVSMAVAARDKWPMWRA